MKKSSKGYTLLELMIVVILIGIVTALAAPQISQAIKNHSLSDAANQTVLAFRTGRSQAARLNKAFGVFVTNGGVRDLVRVDRSASNLCQNLPAMCTVNPPDYGGPNCGIFALPLDDAQWARRGVRMDQITFNGGNPPSVMFCITPRGKMVAWNGAARLPMGAPVEIRFDRTTAGGASVGVKRTVIVTSTGFPRLMI